jgi:hypothetical protein
MSAYGMPSAKATTSASGTMAATAAAVQKRAGFGSDRGPNVPSAVATMACVKMEGIPARCGPRRLE